MAVICLLAAAAGARSLYESEVQSHLYDIGDPPYATVAVHNVGKIAMTVSNIGTLGSGAGMVFWIRLRVCRRPR